MNEELVLVAKPVYLCAACGLNLAYSGLPFSEQIARGEFLLYHDKMYGVTNKCRYAGQSFTTPVPLVGAQHVTAPEPHSSSLARARGIT